MNTLIQKNYLPLIMLILIIALRTLSLNMPGLIDPSDARYANMSQTMSMTDNWLVPMIQQGGENMPYWSKPPLAFWVTAATIEIFGNSVWAARFGTALVTFLTAFFIFLFINKTVEQKNKHESGILAAIIFLTTMSIFGLAGTNMLDPTLSMTVTLGMVGFGLFFLKEQKKIWAYVGFAGFAFGVLAKGPIALAFPGFSLFVFCIWAKKFSLLKSVPWLTGTLLFLLISAPWFILAEREMPGFLSYFLLEENLNRLLSNDTALRHGSVHHTPRGFIWVLLPAMLIPWFFIPICKARHLASSIKNTDPLVKYLLTWFLGPMLILSLSRQILATYILPIIPAFAILVSLFILKQENESLASKFSSVLKLISLIIIGLALCGTFAYEYYEAGQTFQAEFYIAALLIILAGALNFIKPVSGVEKLSLAAGIMTVALVSAGVCATEPINDYSSTKTVLVNISKQYPDRVTKIYFINRIPHSSLFYQAANGYKKLELGIVKSDSVNSLKEGILVVRLRELKQLPENIQNLTREKIGQWQVIRL